MATTRYLVVVYVVTAGLDGDDLGCDEEDIVLFTWLVVDISNCKVIAVQSRTVKPRSGDHALKKDNLLSETARSRYGLTDEMVKSSPPLESVLDEFTLYCREKLHSDSGRSFQLITDGQLHLRQVLHPEAVRKSISLPPFFSCFYDLRKEFTKFYLSTQSSLFSQVLSPTSPCIPNHIASNLNNNSFSSSEENVTPSSTPNSSSSPSPTSQPHLPSLLTPVKSIEGILNFLSLEADASAEPAVQILQNMGNIILRLINDGHKFEEPEEILERLEPGICNKNEVIDGNSIVRARGLPWQSSDQDIAKFFRGCNIVKGGVALCLSPAGRRNGEALIRFVNQEHRDIALKRHKHHIGQRYIEVYPASGEDFAAIACGNNNEAQQFLSRGGQVIVRMRGLPYDCTAKQVIEFFGSGVKSSEVMHGEDGVLFVKKADGRPTGDAFVLFEAEETAGKALQKHRQLIGSRYIELFRSSTAEVQQVLNRSMDNNRGVFNNETTSHSPLIPNLPQVPLIPQQLMPSGSRKDCIRLRGLPYEAQVEQILEFLSEHSKNIVFQGVHMVYNAQGQPSGEAFIQMDSEQSAALAATQRHHKYMSFGKKQRYIEVFQCSIDDMNLVLTGGLPMQRPLLSPGGLANFPSYPFIQNGQVLPAGVAAAAAVTAAASRVPTSYYHPVIYWPYPSPPVSPSTYYIP